MGGGSSQEDIKKINGGEWMNIGMTHNYQIVRSNMGNGEGQIRVIPMDPRHEQSKQKKIYSYRKNTNLPLVKCFGAEFAKSEHKTMCGNQQNVKVLTQRIPRTLYEIQSLPTADSLCLLSESLIGFQDLYDRAGPFEITNKMIGINNNGEPRVWLNENYAENHPAYERPILQTVNTTPQYLTAGSNEKNMVQTIYQLISQKCSPNGLPIGLKSQRLRGGGTFEQAYRNLQQYIKQNNIFVPATIGNRNGMVSANTVQQNTNRHTVAQSLNFNQVIGSERQTTPVSQYGNMDLGAVQSTYTRPSEMVFNRPAQVITTTTYTPATTYTYPNTYSTLQPPPLYTTTTYNDNPYNFGVIRNNETKRTATFGQLPMVGPTKVSLNYVSPANQFVSSQVTRQY